MLLLTWDQFNIDSETVRNGLLCGSKRDFFRDRLYSTIAKLYSSPTVLARITSLLLYYSVKTRWLFSCYSSSCSSKEIYTKRQREREWVEGCNILFSNMKHMSLNIAPFNLCLLPRCGHMFIQCTRLCDEAFSNN